jgi:polo-like kinase 1
MTFCGTPNYIAPEVLDREWGRGHSYEVDIWSLGVIIYTLIIGKPPFDTPYLKTTLQRIKANSYTFPEDVPISDAAKDLITSILSKDPAKRPTLEEITQHKFLKSNSALLQPVRVKKWVDDSS